MQKFQTFEGLYKECVEHGSLCSVDGMVLKTGTDKRDMLEFSYDWRTLREKKYVKHIYG